MGVESHRFAILHDTAAKLQVASVCINVKRFVMVKISQASIIGNQGLHCLESVLMFWKPNKGLGTSQLGKQSKTMSLLGPHITIVVHGANETSQRRNIFRRASIAKIGSYWSTRFTVDRQTDRQTDYSWKVEE